MKPNLRLATADEPTRQQIEMARLEQDWREWTAEGWKPVDNPQRRESLLVDEIQAKSYKVIIVDGPVPLRRRLLRMLAGLIGKQ